MFTWEVKDLSVSDAVDKSSRDYTLSPGSLASQLIHLLAGVQTVFTHHHPLVGGYGNNDAHPAQAAQQEAAHLET